MNKDELYIHLTKEYGFTPEEIANMNPYVQLVYYRGPQIITFETTEQYEAFMRSRK